MDHGNFVGWFSAIEYLSEVQRAEVERALAGLQPLNEVVQVLESRIGADRQCPHCTSPGAVRRGFSNNLRRYHCGNCKKTFNCLTGTPLARLRHKGRWHEFGASLAADETIVQSAQRCNVASSTAFRWLHRFLRAVTSVVKLSGIAEADETFMLESHKGSRTVFVKQVVRRFHAASLISGTLISFSAFNQTGPAGCQLRVLPDQRSGFCARAFA